LVFANDRVENVAQLKRALAAGYNGYVSIEPFSPETQRDPELLANLKMSIDYIKTNV
jgi:2-keto-myo-inositol isomerase